MNLIWALNLVILHVSTYSCRSVLTENPKILKEYLASGPEHSDKNFSFKLNVVPYEDADLNPSADKWSKRQTMKAMKYDKNDRPLTIILAAIPKESKETKDNVAERDPKVSHKLIESLDEADKEVQDTVPEEKLVADTKQDDKLISNKAEDTLKVAAVANRRESNDALGLEEGKKMHDMKSVPSLVIRKMNNNVQDIAQNGHPKYINLPDDDSFTGKFKQIKLWNENMFEEEDLSNAEQQDKDTEDSGFDTHLVDTNESDPDFLKDIELDLPTKDISLQNSSNSEKHDHVFNEHDDKIINHGDDHHKHKNKHNTHSDKGEWLKTIDKSLKMYKLSFVFNR